MNSNPDMVWEFSKELHTCIAIHKTENCTLFYQFKNRKLQYYIRKENIAPLINFGQKREYQHGNWNIFYHHEHWIFINSILKADIFHPKRIVQALRAVLLRYFVGFLHWSCPTLMYWTQNQSFRLVCYSHPGRWTPWRLWRSAPQSWQRSLWSHRAVCRHTGYFYSCCPYSENLGM